MTFLINRSTDTGEQTSQMTPIGKIVRRTEAVALADAHGLIEQARADAADIIEQARAAYQAERERGYAEGMAAARAEQTNTMLQLSQRTSTYLKAVERDLVDLVVASLRRIVADFDASERVLAVVRSGLGLVRQQKNVLLRVHTEDAVLVRQHMQALLEQFPSIDYVDVVADDRYERGACRVETAIGTVETSLDKQMDILQHALEQAVASTSGKERGRGAPALSEATEPPQEGWTAHPWTAHPKGNNDGSNDGSDDV